MTDPLAYDRSSSGARAVWVLKSLGAETFRLSRAPTRLIVSAPRLLIVAASRPFPFFDGSKASVRLPLSETAVIVVKDWSIRYSSRDEAGRADGRRQSHYFHRRRAAENRHKRGGRSSGRSPKMIHLAFGAIYLARSSGDGHRVLSRRVLPGLLHAGG